MGFDAELLKHSRHQVQFSRTHSPAKNQNIQWKPLLHQGPNFRRAVGGDAQGIRNSTGPSYERLEHRPVTVTNLARPWLLAGFDDLIAGGENGNLRSRKNPPRGFSDCGQNAEFPGPQP